MKGYIVKKSIKLAGKTQAEVADSIGISREHLQRMLSTEIDPIYVEKIRAVSIQIVNVTESDENVTGPGKTQWDKLLNLFERTIDMIERDNKVMTRILETGLDEGAIRFDGNIKQSVTKKH